MKRFLYLLIAFAITLSACSGKKYGHYRYTNKQKTKTTRVKKHAKKDVVAIPLKKEDSFIDLVDNNIAVNDSLKLQSHSNKSKKKLNEGASTRNSRQVQGKNHKLKNEENELLKPKNKVDDDEIVENKLAKTAFILAIAALLLTLIGIAFAPLFILAVAAGLAAFIVGMVALKQIGKTPNMYNNRDKAVFAVVIGAIFLVAILLLIIILLIFLLILLRFR